jgi:hypothetical protein
MRHIGGLRDHGIIPAAVPFQKFEAASPSADEAIHGVPFGGNGSTLLKRDADVTPAIIAPEGGLGE